jgi:F-type H+-transporting ATPase subunit b
MQSLMETIGLEPKLVLMQVLSFIILFVLLKRFLFQPVANMIESRNREIAERLANTERDERAMEAVRTEYERRISEIETEARDRIQDAMEEARRIADEIREQGRSDAEALRQRAMLQIEREKEKALKETQDHIVDLAIDAAERVTARAIHADEQRELVRRFIEEVETGATSRS